MSLLAVGDLLEETITRSAKIPNCADGELAWLRTRLEKERRDPRGRGKLALEGSDSSNSNNQGPARSLANKAHPADKENAAGVKHAGSRANKVRVTFSVLCTALQSVRGLTICSFGASRERSACPLLLPCLYAYCCSLCNHTERYTALKSSRSPHLTYVRHTRAMCALVSASKPFSLSF